MEISVNSKITAFMLLRCTRLYERFHFIAPNVPSALCGGLSFFTTPTIYTLHITASLFARLNSSDSCSSEYFFRLVCIGPLSL